MKIFIATFVSLFLLALSGICAQSTTPIHITIWCEAPLFDTGATPSVDQYYDNLFSFINKKNASSDGRYVIDRIISRIQNPQSKGYYYIGGSNCNFLDALLRNNVSLKIFVLPWLNETPDEGGLWGYPVDNSITRDICPSFVPRETWNSIPNNIRRSVLWVQLANEYLSYRKSQARISGIVYESEGAEPWNKSETAFKEFLKDLPGLIPPSPKYSNDSNSEFRFASASQYNFKQYGTTLYVHEIFPQYYNLGPYDSNNLVDATSAYGPGTPVSYYYPEFPKTLYTSPELFNKSKNIADFFYAKQKISPDAPSDPDDPQGKTMNDRRSDISCMFSTELAPATEPKSGISNPYHYRAYTITGASKTGTINAFGVAKYSNWDDFIAFLIQFREKFQNNGAGIDLDHFALFQYNMFPPEWNQKNDSSK